MNDKELADKVVALGLARETEIMAGGHGNEHPETIYILNDNTLNAKDAKQFVREWSVAGALMERVINKDTRAIIEACVEALEPVLD